MEQATYRTAVSLRRQFVRLAATGCESLKEQREADLRRRVWALVDELRERGSTSEQVVVTVKELAEEAGLHTTRGSLSGKDAPVSQDDVIEKAVRIAIERYYGDNNIVASKRREP